MKLVVAVFASCLLILATLFTALFFVSGSPSTAELEGDIAAVRQELVAAEAEAAQYGTGSALHLLSMYRVTTLKTSEAMLTQKRYSMLRRIDLVFNVEGRAHTADPAKIAGLEVELTRAQAERDRLVAEAALYAGGLVQVVALMNAATSEMAVSQVRLGLLAERYGLMLPAPTTPEPEDPLGQQVVPEGEAL